MLLKSYTCISTFPKWLLTVAHMVKKPNRHTTYLVIFPQNNLLLKLLVYSVIFHRQKVQILFFCIFRIGQEVQETPTFQKSVHQKPEEQNQYQNWTIGKFEHVQSLQRYHQTTTSHQTFFEQYVQSRGPAHCQAQRPPAPASSRGTCPFAGDPAQKILPHVHQRRAGPHQLCDQLPW